MKNRMLTIGDLQKIGFHESGEPLIDLEEKFPDILCDYRRVDSGVSRVLIRKSAAEKLHWIQQRLTSHNPSMQLLVVEGYRHPEYQEQYYLKQLFTELKNNPAIEFKALVESVHQLVALPSVAGHPTGGAIDLTIAYEGKKMDMGGAIADFSNPQLLPTYSSSITTAQAKNRILLHDLMTAEGFAPILWGMVAFFLWGSRMGRVLWPRSNSLWFASYLDTLPENMRFCYSLRNEAHVQKCSSFFS